METNTKEKYSKYRVFILFLVCFSGFGLRIFDGDRNYHFALIFILSLRYLKDFPLKYITRFVIVTACAFIFFKMKSMTLEAWIVRAWLTSLIVIGIYWKRPSMFEKDFSKLAEWSMYYSLLHIPAYLLFPSTSWRLYETVFYVFFYNTADTFLGIPRIQGFAWEPSCWSYMLITNLVFMLYHKENKIKIGLSLIAILFCNSTTVIMSAAAVVGVYLWFVVKKNKWLIPAAFVVGLIGFSFAQQKLSEKMETGSGLARLSDFYILYDVMKQNPLLGDDAYNVSNSMLAYQSRLTALYNSGQDISNVGEEGYYGEEMVNDLAALLVEWGIILGPFILLLYLKTPLLEDRRLRIIFFVGTMAVITGTPITRTGIFFLFPLSVLIMTPKEALNLFKIKKKVEISK